MTSPPFPLFDAFQALRRRQFNVGLSEYLLALEALQAGFGGGSREALVFLCQTLWANSREEQEAVAAVLEDLLPERWTEDELARRLDEADAEPAAPRGPSEAAEPTAPPPEAPPAVPTPAAPEEAPARAAREAGERLVAPVIRFRHARCSLDFVGGLPVTKRQMKRAWRYYRRMQRAGPPTELDVHATVEAMYRAGVLARPVLVPRRSNQARMLLLVDEGGSMVPFRYVVGPLLETAQHGGLARVAVYYFHDVPGDHLFRDPRRTQPEAFEQAVAPFAGAGVLVVGDAGAARGNLDAVRLRDTLIFLRRVRGVTPHVAWVNPTPADRWANTTAEAIRTQSDVPMFTLDRAGLDAAVDVLRGRTS